MPDYPNKFASLLHIEELQMEVDIRHYDMEDTTLTPNGQFLVLKVHNYYTVDNAQHTVMFPNVHTYQYL